MGRPLDAITIKGFKSIKALEAFELRSLNVLIGANGSGKTNFISIFKLLNQILEENLQVFVGQSGGADNLLYFGQKTTSEIIIKLKFGNNGYNCTLVPTSDDSLIFSDEEVWFHNPNFPNPYSLPLGGGQKETRLKEYSLTHTSTTIADHVLRAIRSWRIYHFHDTSPSSRIKQTGELNDNEALRSDASNLASFLYLLNQKSIGHYKKIVSTIKLVAPFFDDFQLKPSRLNPEKIQLEWKERGSDTYFDAQALSDGTLRFICLATLLLQPELPSTILIDEPELGLHPYAITLLASLLRSAAVQTQVIVSTQSVPLVNQFYPDDIVVVDRKDNQSTFTRHVRVDLETWLDEYGMGDLWEKNLLGGRPA